MACVSEGHGPFESLFAEICSATPLVRSARTGTEFPWGWIPYFPDVPLPALADVIAGQSTSLRRLQSLLLRRTRELKGHEEKTAAIRELELDIVDALAQMKDNQLRYKRKAGWAVADEALAGSAVSFDRDELLGAAWRSNAGTGLYSSGRPEAAVTAAEWMPVLTLQSLGYRWQVTPTATQAQTPERYRGPGADEQVGAWLAPPNQGVTMLVVQAEE